MLSIPHLILIFVVALVVFGPEKLPELARNFGKVMAELKRTTNEMRSTFEDHLRDLEREASARTTTSSTAAPASSSNSDETPRALPEAGTVPTIPANRIGAGSDARARVPAQAPESEPTPETTSDGGDRPA